MSKPKKPEDKVMSEQCTWQESEDYEDYYDTECGIAVEDYNIKSDNRIKYCRYCGKEIDIKMLEEEKIMSEEIKIPFCDLQEMCEEQHYVIINFKYEANGIITCIETKNICENPDKAKRIKCEYLKIKTFVEKNNK